MDEKIILSSSEQVLWEELNARGAATAEELCGAVSWSHPAVAAFLARMVRKGAVFCDDANGETVYHLTDRKIIVNNRAVRPVKSGVLCVASPMGGGKRALRGRVALIGKRRATKKVALAALLVCVALTCLVACTGRVGSEEAYQKFAKLAAQTETIQPSEGYCTISGKTMANYLQGRTWEPAERKPDERLYSAVTFDIYDENGSITNSMRVAERADGTCLATFWMLDDSGVNIAETSYLMSKEEFDLAFALTWLADEEHTLRSAWPGSGDGEFALVCGGVAMGHQSHWLFRSDNGVDYVPVENNMDEVCSRVAENFLFVNEQVGFASFRSVGDEPVLLRTADGGATWAVAELPLGGVRADQGYEDIQITTIEFWDEKNGQVTVTSHYGNSGPLACVFYTEDGGKNFYGVTTGGSER